MKEAVDDIMVTLNEAASEVGLVGGMVDAIAEAMSKVGVSLLLEPLQPHPRLSHIPSLHALLWETDCQSRLRPANLLFPMAVANEQVASHIANILFILHY